MGSGTVELVVEDHLAQEHRNEAGEAIGQAAKALESRVREGESHVAVWVTVAFVFVLVSLFMVGEIAFSTDSGVVFRGGPALILLASAAWCGNRAKDVYRSLHQQKLSASRIVALGELIRVAPENMVGHVWKTVMSSVFPSKKELED